MPRTTRGGAPGLAAMLAAAALAAGSGLPPREARAAGGDKPIDPVMQQQIAADRAASQAQKRLNEIDDETREMAARYRQYLSETENLEEYMKLLSAQVESQEEEIGFIEEQLQEIEVTAREITPLMQRMVATLEQFVALDLPFLTEERRRRVETLQEMMERADVSISEKYRRILEAYQIEAEYGRTLEAYQGEVGEGEDVRAVQFLRIGRIALLYQTMDGEETGYWDDAAEEWVKAPEYRAAVSQGFEVAEKRGAPDIFTAPVPAPERADGEASS